MKNLGNSFLMKLMNLLSPIVILYQKCWEWVGWKNFNYPVYEKLARMIPGIFYELYPLKFGDRGNLKLLIHKRPDDDKSFGGQWHNLGTGQRSTDVLWKGAVSNEKSLNTVPEEVIRELKESVVWELNPRDTAIYRLLVGNEIGYSKKEALKTLSDIRSVADYPLEMTKRGPEKAQLNVWIMIGDQVSKIKIKNDQDVRWVDITELPDMVNSGDFMEHQLNRLRVVLKILRKDNDNISSI